VANSPTPAVLGAATPNVPFRAAIAWLTATSRARISASYSSIVDEQTAPIPAVTVLQFGNRSDNTRSLDGYIRRIQYWPIALSAAQLQAITQ